jgi:hypothetical protein
MIQIGCIGSNLRIIDYSLGYTGSAHDAIAFEQTAAYRYPELVYRDDEFAWADSAYAASYRVIPVHKAPANLDPKVLLFDTAVSRLWIRSEHCNGAIKGRWQSLKGLRITINRKHDHVRAMHWISACFILHNITVEVEGSDWVEQYAQEEVAHNQDRVAELTEVDNEGEDAEVDEEVLVGRARRDRLVEEYFQFYQQQYGPN